MSIAASFLGGAKSRLLPASVPFRFFATAAGFHVLMWLVLLANAGQATGFRGGLGSTLAAVHLLTLGVLTATAIGASVQLLPVATRRTLHAVWPIKLIFWLAVPGTIALIGGMYTGQTSVLIAAAVITSVGLLLFCGLLADNLRRAGSLPVVGAYGWAALAALILVIVLGAALAINEEAGILADHAAVALAHMILGGFGFMGLLALGFSHILIPMFALAQAPAKRPSFASFVAAAVAIALGTFGALIGSRDVLAAAARIAPSDRQRIQRALEVHVLTNRPITELQQADDDRKRPGVLAIALVPAGRADLAVRIERRFDSMLTAGFLHEIELLRARGDLRPDMPAMRAVGYRQLWAYLDGRYTWQEAREKAIVATRQYAKRQLTWLRGDPRIENWPALASGLVDRCIERLAKENLIAKNARGLC